VLLVKETPDALRYLGADLFRPLQLFLIRFRDFVHIAECIRQELRRSLADKRDAQAIQDPRQRLLPRRFDILQKLLGRFLAHALQRDQIVERQPVEIGDVLDQSAVDQLRYQGLPHSVDIHNTPRGEM
jgi:hypothetical protein